MPFFSAFLSRDGFTVTDMLGDIELTTQGAEEGGSLLHSYVGSMEAREWLPTRADIGHTFRLSTAAGLVLNIILTGIEHHGPKPRMRFVSIGAPIAIP